jgi:hypothetical protein
VACLYCGKDIGPFRSLRDSEFCSDGHRKSYAARLGKAINLMQAPEPAPAGMAGFRDALVPTQGSHRPSLQRPVPVGNYEVRPGKSWPLAVSPLLGADFRPYEWRPGSVPADAHCRLRLRMQLTVPGMPPLPLRLADEGATTARARTRTMSPDGDAWMWLREPRVAPGDRQPMAAGEDFPAVGTWLPAELSLPGAGLPRTGHHAEPLNLVLSPKAPVAAKMALDTRPLDPAPAWLQMPPLGLTASEPDVLHALRALKPCGEPGPGLAAEAAARELRVLASTHWCATAHSAQAPAFTLSVAETDVFEAVPAPAPCESPLRGHAAESAAREVRPAVAPEAFAPAGGMPEAPPLAIGLPRTGVIPACEVPSPAHGSEAAMREVRPASAAAWTSGAECAGPRLPEFLLAAAETDVLEIVGRPDPCEDAIPAGSAQPAEREVRSAVAAAAAAVPEVRLPASPQFRGGALSVFPDEGPLVGPAAAPTAAPVAALCKPAAVAYGTAFAAPVLPGLAPPSPQAQSAADPLPAIADTAAAPQAAGEDDIILRLRLPDAAALRTAERWAGCRAVEPQPASRPVSPAAALTAAVASSAASVSPPLPVPVMGPQLAAAGLRNAHPRAAAPRSASLATNAVRVQPMISMRMPAQPLEAVRGVLGIPETGFIPVEFYCQRAASTPSMRAQWATGGGRLVVPGIGFALLADRTEDLPTAKPAAKADVTEILSHPEAAKRRAVNRKISRIVRIAAALLLGVSLWYAYRSPRLDSSMEAVNRAIEPAPAESPGARGQNEAAPAAGGKQGAFARLRNAIADRAAYEVTDSLRDGMTSWGAAEKRWAPGWAHQPEGFTHVGGLELFHPSLKYRDYRLEFLGQVETKGMGWVVRAQDKQNYYAMKFKVVEAGLRPVIALVHYPVVAGRKGHTVETPLSVMIHRNMPFRVEVNVRGNRLTASVEGQAVESWTDDLLARGAVGFFSETGETARLYWMKVSKNQDWLGAVCSFLAGGETQTAGVWRQADPPGRGSPDLPPQDREVALAEAEPGQKQMARRVAARVQNQGRIRTWIS